MTPKSFDSASPHSNASQAFTIKQNYHLDAAEADPSHLDMVAAAPAAATVLTAEGAEAAAAMEDANHGLVNFQLVPKVGASCQ